jgi:hypothetical protein
MAALREWWAPGHTSLYFLTLGPLFQNPTIGVLVTEGIIVLGMQTGLCSTEAKV